MGRYAGPPDQEGRPEFPRRHLQTHNGHSHFKARSQEYCETEAIDTTIITDQYLEDQAPQRKAVGLIHLTSASLASNTLTKK